jgi:hypothetical protein
MSNVQPATSGPSRCCPQGSRYQFEEGTNRFRYESGEQAWKLCSGHYGPAKSLAASLDAVQREEFKRDMISWHDPLKSELGYDQPRRCVATYGIRR